MACEGSTGLIEGLLGGTGGGTRAPTDVFLMVDVDDDAVAAVLALLLL